jgi:hypothetical protein
MVKTHKCQELIVKLSICDSMRVGNFFNNITVCVFIIHPWIARPFAYQWIKVTEEED